MSQVKLLSDVKSDGDRVVVSGAGLYGTAAWRGNDPHAAGEDVTVELDVESEVSWADILVDSSIEAADSLFNRDGDCLMLIAGIVEDVDERGVATLRVAGGVVLLETTGEPPLGVVGRRVTTVCREVSLYPVTY